MEMINRKMLVERNIEVHTYDVDFMQIVNNTVYVKWFEDLRMAMMDEYIPLTETMKDYDQALSELNEHLGRI